MQFSVREAGLEGAINADDADAVRHAIAAGARVNASGTMGVTPLEYAVGTLRARAAGALISSGADPNAKDDEGDTPVTVAATAYSRDPSLLKMLLAAGGDPNTRRPNGDPIITRFTADHDLDAITYMKSVGADINAQTRTGLSLLNSAAMTEDWDVVWCLLQLGAQFSDVSAPNNILTAFRTPLVTPQGSLRWECKVKVWRFPKAQGLNPIPPDGISPAGEVL